MYVCMYVSICMCFAIVVAFEARLDALMSYVTLPEVVHNSTVWLGRVKMHMDSEKVPTQTQVSHLLYACMYALDCFVHIDKVYVCMYVCM